VVFRCEASRVDARDGGPWLFMPEPESEIDYPVDGPIEDRFVEAPRVEGGAKLP
jgi:hypothetical protein